MDAALKEALLGGATRRLGIRFPDNDHAAITEGIVSGSPRLECVLNSSKELDFGECNAAQFSVEVEGLDNIAGKRIQVYEVVEGYALEVKLFTGKVYSAIRQPETNTRLVTAYDALYYLADEDVTEWYQEVFPDNGSISVRAFRDYLFAYIGITQASQTLMNDSVMLVEYYLSGETVTFGGILKMICQMNACFGHIDPDGSFRYISLGDESCDYSGNYQGTASRYGEYAIQPIDRIRIFDAGGNVSINMGNGTNLWNLAGNILLYAVTGNALLTLATRLYQHVNAISMKNVELEALLSLPVSLGSRLTFTTHTGETVESYVLENRFHGSQLVSQNIVASLDERRINALGKNEQDAIINARIKAAEEAAGKAIIESVREYTVTDTTDPPDEEAEWSSDTPEWQEGQYIWERTVNTYGTGETETSSPVLVTGNSGAAGEDAVLLRLDSSAGTMFKNNNVNTVISVTIYKGSQVITDADTMHTVFGAGAYIQWSWRRLDDDRYGIISSDDSRIFDGGFKFRLSSADVDTKVTFQCGLMV